MPFSTFVTEEKLLERVAQKAELKRSRERERDGSREEMALRI